MQPLQSKEAIERRNIADLAKEFTLPLAEVRALYEAQRARLMKGAKVGKYFSIVAVRNIRLQLAKRRTSPLVAVD
jgi:ribosomal protein L13E